MSAAKRPRKMRMSPAAAATAHYVAAALRELRAKEGYVVYVNIGAYDSNPQDYLLPDAKFPQVFKALYEAVDYAERQSRYHDKVKVKRLTPSGEDWPPFHSQVVWRSWGAWETEDRARQKRRRAENATARKGRTLEHVRRDVSRRRRA